MKNSDLPVQAQILNISVNMARVGNWIADSYEEKRSLVNKFLDQTKDYLSQLPKDKISSEFQPTLKEFENIFKDFREEQINKNRLFWAEKALTWANILQHRAKLA